MHQSVNEKRFILDALSQSLRIDGRSLLDARNLTLTFPAPSNSGARGICDVQLGKTRVLGSVECTVAEPYPDRPTEGFLVFSVSRPVPSTSTAPQTTMLDRALERLLDRTIRASRAVDTEALCIAAGEQVWSLTCRIRIVDDGGNVADAAVVAAVGALLHVRKPDVTFDSTTGAVTIHSVDERPPVPLAIHHVPLAVTFGFLEDGRYVIVDPIRQEEACMGGSMVVAVNALGEVCLVHKNGGTLVSDEVVAQCMEVAAQRVQKMYATVRGAVDADEAKRRANAGGSRTYARANQVVA
jgi:exosome complex component RRP45